MNLYSTVLWFYLLNCILHWLHLQGNALFKEGKYEEAINCYTTGIQFDPTNAVLPANRAMCLLKLKRSVCVFFLFVKCTLRSHTAVHPVRECWGIGCYSFVWNSILVSNWEERRNAKSCPYCKKSGCKVQLHISVLLHGKHPKVGDSQPGWSTVGTVYDWIPETEQQTVGSKIQMLTSMWWIQRITETVIGSSLKI